jgi:prevent-host-death family protein
MIRTTLSDAKKHLSELVARVGRGETVIVTKRGKPVARIEAVSTAEVDGDAEVVAELLGLGLLRRPPTPAPAPLAPPVELPEGVSVLDTLLDERAEGR